LGRAHRRVADMEKKGSVLKKHVRRKPYRGTNSMHHREDRGEKSNLQFHKIVLEKTSEREGGIPPWDLYCGKERKKD